MTVLRRIVPVVAAMAVLVAAVVVVAGTISTSSARVAARTDVSSFIAAGSVELTRSTSSVDLFFDADGLYPGADVEGCVEVDYLGSVPADIRLHADHLGGDGLEHFVEFRVDVFAGGCEDSTAASDSPVFEDTLHELFDGHNSYGTGVSLREGQVAGERLGVRANARMTGGNEAQGLTVDFMVTIEARP